MSLDNLSDTAYWMAYMRALETERPDALFKDPYARDLAGPLGKTLSERIGSIQLIATSIAVRTAVLDALILDMVPRLNVDRVLSIGSGFDTRPWRVPLPSTLTWIDIDLPAVLNHKARTLARHPPVCEYRSIGVDIFNAGQRRAILEECAQADRVMVITEGLLVYMQPTRVEELARDIHAQPACQWWLTDLVTARVLERLKAEWSPRLGNAQFHFAPSDSGRFFARLGWREVKFHSSWEEGRRLGRTPPLPWIPRLLLALSSSNAREQFRRLAGIAVLARDAPLEPP